MAAGGPAPLARMYREQLGRRARPIGTVGLLPELNGCSFETEEYCFGTSLVAPRLQYTYYTIGYNSNRLRGPRDLGLAGRRRGSRRSRAARTRFLTVYFTFDSL